MYIIPTKLLLVSLFAVALVAFFGLSVVERLRVEPLVIHLGLEPGAPSAEIAAAIAGVDLQLDPFQIVTYVDDLRYCCFDDCANLINLRHSTQITGKTAILVTPPGPPVSFRTARP